MWSSRAPWAACPAPRAPRSSWRLRSPAATCAGVIAASLLERPLRRSGRATLLRWTRYPMPSSGGRPLRRAGSPKRGHSSSMKPADSISGVTGSSNATSLSNSLSAPACLRSSRTTQPGSTRHSRGCFLKSRAPRNVVQPRTRSNTASLFSAVDRVPARRPPWPPSSRSSSKGS